MASRRFQFGLKTLLIAVACAAYATHWGIQYWATRSADAKFQRAVAACEVDGISIDDFFAASDALLAASLRVPFFSRAEAHRSQVHRIAGVLKWYEMQYRLVARSGHDDEEAELRGWLNKSERKYNAALDALRKEAGIEYAVKADDEVMEFMYGAKK